VRVSHCVVCGAELVTEQRCGRLPHRCKAHRWVKGVKGISQNQESREVEQHEGKSDDRA
jgi:hypothetical protein